MSSAFPLSIANASSLAESVNESHSSLDAVLSSGQLYVQLVGRTGQRQAAADRTNALHGVVREVLRVLNVGVNLADQVEAAIDAVTFDGLTPTMSAPGGGYESDGMRAPSIMAVARLASTSTVEGVTKTLDEKLAYTQMLVSQIAERLGQSPVEIQVADIVRPEEMENRERARPHSQRYAANSGAGTKAEHADWDPLNYRPGR